VSRGSSELTAAQEILLGAAKLAAEGGADFSEWDLTVSTWERNKNRFGCRGYEDKYPDHKRVMMEIMGQTKKDNPIRRGWFEKARPNFYRLTPQGQAEADRLLERKGELRTSTRSAQPIYDAIHPYAEHRAFRDHSRDAEEPRMWLGAASFLGLTRNEKVHLEDRLKRLNLAIDSALSWMNENGQDQLRRGVTGGGTAIYKEDVLKLREFAALLLRRFKVQLDAIRGSAKPAG